MRQIISVIISLSFLNTTAFAKVDSFASNLSDRGLSVYELGSRVLEMDRNLTLSKETLSRLSKMVANVDPKDLEAVIETLGPEKVVEISQMMNEIRFLVTSGEKVDLAEVILASQAGQQVAGWPFALVIIALGVGTYMLMTSGEGQQSLGKLRNHIKNRRMQ